MSSLKNTQQGVRIEEGNNSTFLISY